MRSSNSARLHFNFVLLEIYVLPPVISEKKKRGFRSELGDVSLSMSLGLGKINMAAGICVLIVEHQQHICGLR